MLLDTNVVIRHLTYDPPELGKRASRVLRSARSLRLTDVVLAECVYVLESVYSVSPRRVAGLLASLISLPAVESDAPFVALRALAVHGAGGLGFPDAYLVAHAEAGDLPIVSFDRKIDRVATIVRVEP